MDTYHQRYHSHLAAALDAQQKIGGLHLIHGFLATAWQELAAINMLQPTTPGNPRGHHRNQMALKVLHLFTRTLWLGHNEALHHEKDTAAAKHTQPNPKISDTITPTHNFLISRTNSMAFDPLKNS
jgi:hypothetical protein